MTKVIQIVGNVVLARILAPEAFGLVAVASVVVGAVMTVSEMGIGYALIQSQRTDERFVNTAWSMQVMRGAGVFLVCAVLAYPVAKAYDAPEVAGIMLVVALGSLVSGLRSTNYVTLNRQLNERPRAMLELGNHVVSRAAMIVLALMWPCALAIVVGNFVGILFVTGATHRLAGVRNRLAWDRDAARTLFRMGGWVVVGSAIAYLGGQLDALVLARLVQGELGALGLVGVYTISQRFAWLPLEAAALIGGTLGYPVLAEVVRREPARLRERLLEMRHVLLSAGLALCIGLLVLAPYFFKLLYDERYAAAQWMAPLFMLTVWINFLNQLPNRALLALGRTRPLALTGAAKVAVSVLCGAGGFFLFGVAGFILGVAVGDLVRHVAESTTLARAGASTLRQDLVFSLAFLVLAGICVLSGSLSLGRGGSWEPLVLSGVPIVVLLGLTVWAARQAYRALWPTRAR